MAGCPLSKRVPRELLKNCGKYLGMALILICTISIGSSFQTTLDGATRYLSDIKVDNLQEDGYFEVPERIPAEDDFFRENGVEVYENFYVAENEYEDESKILVFCERTKVDIPVLFAGKMPQKPDEIALDHVFARSRGIAVGDTLRLLNRDFTVCGTVSLPDYTSLFMNNTDLVMNTSHFCVSVVTEEAFAGFSEELVIYRYSYRLTERDLSKPDRIEKSEDMMKHLASTGNIPQSFLRSDQNQSIVFLEMDMGTDGPFMQVFVYLLVALIAFVFAILTNNTIEKESVIIGTLLASGYKKSEIVWHYLQPTLIVALVGSAVGNLIGYTVMIQPFLDIYYTTYSIGPLHIVFSAPAFALTTVLPVLIMVCINYLMLMKKLSLSPLKFLRHDLSKKKQRKAVKLPDFSFLNRFRLRVILQNRGSYIMLFCGIFLASFLLMFGIGLNPLMEYYTESVDRSLPYNYQYFLKAPANTDRGDQVYVYEMDTWFELGKKNIGVTLMGIEKDSTFFGGALADHGVGISSALSGKLGLKEGDTLRLTDTNTEKEYELTVGRVYPYEATLTVFLERDELTGLLEKEKGSYNCILSAEKLELEDACIARVITRSDLLGAASQMMDSFKTVIDFINIFSVAVYMVLMYILTKVVIDKNALSISFMKVFGYEKKEISRLYLKATTIVVAVSLVVCIPVEIALFKLVLVFLSSMIEGYLEFYLPGRVYAAIIVIGLAAYYLINALHLRTVERIPMTEALKNRE